MSSPYNIDCFHGRAIEILSVIQRESEVPIPDPYDCVRFVINLSSEELLILRIAYPDAFRLDYD